MKRKITVPRDRLTFHEAMPPAAVKQTSPSPPSTSSSSLHAQPPPSPSRTLRSTGKRRIHVTAFTNSLEVSSSAFCPAFTHRASFSSTEQQVARIEDNLAQLLLERRRSGHLHNSKLFEKFTKLFVLDCSALTFFSTSISLNWRRRSSSGCCNVARLVYRTPTSSTVPLLSPAGR